MISFKISLKFVPKVPIDNIPALVQIMAWLRPGDKPLFEPMMVSLLTHILGLNALKLTDIWSRPQSQCVNNGLLLKHDFQKMNMSKSS